MIGLGKTRKMLLGSGDGRVHASSKAIALVGGLLIAGMLLGGHLIQSHVRSASLDKWRLQVSKTTALLAEESQISLNAARTVLQTIAQRLDRPEIYDAISLRQAAAAPGADQALAELIRGVPAVRRVVLLASNGEILSASDGSRGSWADRETFRIHLGRGASPEVFVSLPERIDGQWHFTLSQRLTNPSGQMTGVVMVQIGGAYYQRLFEAASPGPGSAFTLLRQDLTALVVWPEGDNLKTSTTGLRLAADPLGDDSNATGLAPGQARLIESGGRTRLLARQTLSELPVMVQMVVADTLFLQGDSAFLSALQTGEWLAALGLAAVFVRLYTGFRHREQAVEEAVALREQAEAAASELRLAASVFDSTLESILVVDRSRTIRSVNPAFVDMTGYRGDEAVGRSPRFLDSGRQAGGLFRSIWRSLRKTGFWQGELWIRCKTGEQIQTWHSMSAVRDECGRVVRVVSVFSDSSRRLAAEKALLEKTEALARSNADLEQFAYVASHDLREPLRMISSYLALIERRYATVLDDDGHEFIGYARDGATRMDKLILDLLDYSRVGRSGKPIQPVPLNELIRGVIDSLRIRVAETRAIVAVAADLPVVVGSEHELTRLFLNLISNALKYHSSDRQPRIDIGWSPAENGMAHLWVRDNGIGIPRDQTDRIFLIFQRLHTRQDFEGTGIGLAVCRKIVDGHGGRVWVDSEPGVGSVFHVTLPRG